MNGQGAIGIVVIGRNEGQRLIDCLTSLGSRITATVYVDSGSTDGSVEAAQRLGARVLQLDMTSGFTAARARNAGFARLVASQPEIGLVQFVDGDCMVDAGWLARAAEELRLYPDCAVVCGRRRERRPDATIYNWLCDREWDTPIGEADACGGDALMRRTAFEAVRGYREDLVAGEEPELCLRLRRLNWKIRRIDHEMTLHDAAITRFGQWWRRSVRAGHAFAEVSWMYRHAPDRIWQASTRRAVLWSALLPASLLLALLVGPAALLLLLAYPAQAARLALKAGWRDLRNWQGGALSILGKFAEVDGVLRFHLRRLQHRRSQLIEYKG
ncbi:glycosyltransferase [Rhizobium sp. YIM 134829]|uniref:glycosyltransferase n=1 Tax=Rhizobium sp. YIM 134829 TaxID=3390453 RepID=UPI00397E6AD4